MGAPFLVVPLALTVATWAVERIGGVVGISEGTGATDSSEDFRGVYRECLGCDSAFVPYPYHLFNSEARHDLAKRAPLPKKPFPFPLAFKKPKAKKPFKPFGKKFFPFLARSPSLHLARRGRNPSLRLARRARNPSLNSRKGVRSPSPSSRKEAREPRSLPRRAPRSRSQVLGLVPLPSASAYQPLQLADLALVLMGMEPLAKFIVLVYS